ncbi:MAG: flagellar hook-associated protein 3 [Planctomycetes bacterium]|nr:flagellar hook-associated protein 3 [Planctomycetota bacterium]
MSPRVSTNTGFRQVLNGITFNQLRLVRTQNQASTGKRVLQPSDDPAAMSRTIQLMQRSAQAQRAMSGIVLGLSDSNLGASTLEDASGMIADARVLVLQGLNGTLSDEDREAIASQIELIREQLLDAANFQIDGRHLFSGTATDKQAFEELSIGGHLRAVYRGNHDTKYLRIGSEGEVSTNVPGSRVFAHANPSGASLSSKTGLELGSSAHSGSGFEHLVLRHDSTSAPGLAAAGIALAAGGADDTFLGDQALVVDPVAGTITLGDGDPVAIPGPGSAALVDLQVANGSGGTIHLDLSGWSSAAFNGTVSGAGSISIDGSTFEPIDFASADQQIVHAATGAIVNLDMTGVESAGEALLSFDGAVNVFDALQIIAETLKDPNANEDGLLAERLNRMLDELDRGHSDVLEGMGKLGAQSSRMNNANSNLGDLDVRIKGLVSDRMDADYSEIAIDLAKGQLSLQAVMAVGSRILETSFVRFLS